MYPAAARTLTDRTALGGAWIAAASREENLAPAAEDTLIIPGDACLTDDDAAAVAEVAEIRIDAAATLTVEKVDARTIGLFGRLHTLYTQGEVEMV